MLGGSAPGHENGGGAMLRGGRPSLRRSAQPGVASPSSSLTAGTPRRPRLSPPRGEHAYQSLRRVGTPLGRHERQGENDGGRESALLRAGRAQADGGGLPDRAGAGRGARAGGPPLRGDDGRPAGAARLVAGARL